MDTIFAVSSGAGRAAIAIIRISGPATLRIVEALCRKKLQPRVATLATLFEPISGDVLDRAVCLLFKAPNSFTGEDLLELHLHGGRAVTQGVLSALGQLPQVRVAEPGEFTRRAFNNGKLDLDSAEGLADLIQADTALQRKRALSVMGGGLSAVIANWREQIIEAQALMEAWLEFPDEDGIGDGLVASARDTLQHLIDALTTSLDKIERSEVLRDGYRVLIAGPPNVGKSSLLNRIAEREAAIVSDIPGTTRDLIEIRLDVHGIPLILLDGAGVRAASDPIEKIGIDRVRTVAESVQLILWINAVGVPPTPPPEWARQTSADIVLVRSKSDLASAIEGEHNVSSLTGYGVDNLIKLAAQKAAHHFGDSEDTAFLRQRHVGALERLIAELSMAVRHLDTGKIEIALEDCRAGVKNLAQIGDGVHSDQVLDAVFSRFCIGK